jgi:serine protease SohB
MIKTFLKLLPAKWRKKQSTIHVLRLQGAISAGGGLRPALNAKDLEPLLKRAFRKGASGVALAINCPGGSPVQSRSMLSVKMWQHPVAIGSPVLPTKSTPMTALS